MFAPFDLKLNQTAIVLHCQTSSTALAPLRLKLNQQALAFQKEEKLIALSSPNSTNRDRTIILKLYQLRSHSFVLSSIKKRALSTKERSDR